MTMKRRYQVKATAYDRRGRIISVAFNDYDKTHPIQHAYAHKANLPNKQSLHAEILAIVRAKGKKIYKLKIERYDKQGNPKDAYPCPVCRLAIADAKIELIEHTIG